MDKAVQGRTAHGWNGRGAKPDEARPAAPTQAVNREHTSEEGFRPQVFQD